MDDCAWPILIGGMICLVNSVNERDPGTCGAIKVTIKLTTKEPTTIKFVTCLLLLIIATLSTYRVQYIVKTIHKTTGGAIGGAIKFG